MTKETVCTSWEEWEKTLDQRLGFNPVAEFAVVYPKASIQQNAHAHPNADSSPIERQSQSNRGGSSRESDTMRRGEGSSSCTCWRRCRGTAQPAPTGRRRQLSSTPCMTPRHRSVKRQMNKEYILIRSQYIFI